MKRIAAITMLFILSFSILFGLNASAKSQYIPKFVSVVYDDSGSVHQNGLKNWAYANYAMQSFCGLLNKQDKLFVTYLSTPDKPVEMDLLSNKQQTIEGIRNHSDSKDTPFSAIDSAYNVFAGIPNSSKSTQYWLVIITDGKFITHEKTETTEEVLTSQTELSQKLNNMAQSKMPNGSTVKIMYLAIGSDAISPDPAQVKNMFLYPEYGSKTVFSGETIVGIMSTIADKIAGKTRLNSAQITFLDDKTVKVESKIKLVNIAVLSQKNAAKLLSAKIENGKDLNLEQSISLTYPQVSGRITDENLNGSISLIGTDEENINAGTYILSFSEAVAADSFAVLFEPAIEIRMMLYYPDGREITDVGVLLPGDTIHILYKAFETGTDNEVSLDSLGTSAKHGLTYYEDGNKTGSTVNDQSAYIITLTGAEIKISSFIVIEGFEPIESIIEFTPKQTTGYTAVASENDGSEIGRRKLINNEKTVRFIIIMIPTVLLFFYGFIFKKRFKSNSKISYISINIRNGLVTAPVTEWKVAKLDTASKWIIIPWLRNRRIINGITFYAVVNNAVGIMPKHAGGKTIRLDEDMVDDEKAVVIPVSTLGNSIVSSNGDERRKQSMIILMSGQSLLISSDMVTGTIYKLTSRKH